MTERTKIQPHSTGCKVQLVVTLPFSALRRKYPSAKIDFWGTEATREFEIVAVMEAHSIGGFRGITQMEIQANWDA